MQTIDQAKTAGYTRNIGVLAGTDYLDLLIKPETDLDGSFRAYEVETGDFVLVAGWNVSVEYIN